jgi:hypothetical protein
MLAMLRYAKPARRSPSIDMHKRKDGKPVFKGAGGFFKVYTKDNTWAFPSSAISYAAQHGVEIAEDDLWCCCKCYQSPHYTKFGARRWNAVRDGRFLLEIAARHARDKS